MDTSSSNMSVNGLQTIKLKGAGKAGISFDLADVKMSDKQKNIVQKLFNQNPVGNITLEKHDSRSEKGKEGPGSKYLSNDEFEEIRTLGVRVLGPEVDGPIVDFCLHVVNVGPLQQFEHNE